MRIHHISDIVQKPETFYVSSCGLSVISIFSTSHLLEMSNQRSDLADGEDGSGSREYTFYKVYARQKTKLLERSIYRIKIAAASPSIEDQSLSCEGN